MRSRHRQANIVKKKERSLLLSRGEERFDAGKLQFRQGEDFMNCYGKRAGTYTNQAVPVEEDSVCKFEPHQGCVVKSR